MTAALTLKSARVFPLKLGRVREELLTFFVFFLSFGRFVFPRKPLDGEEGKGRTAGARDGKS